MNNGWTNLDKETIEIITGGSNSELEETESPKKVYLVTLETTGREVYAISAASEEEAEAIFFEGEIVYTETIDSTIAEICLEGE